MKSKSTSELKATIHKVEEICKSNKLGLTEIRKQVFEIIITNNKPVKAYEILDKISQSGYDSLSKEEKDFLFKVGKK